jgi:hypothetical protein
MQAFTIGILVGTVCSIVGFAFLMRDLVKKGKLKL